MGAKQTCCCSSGGGIESHQVSFGSARNSSSLGVVDLSKLQGSKEIPASPGLTAEAFDVAGWHPVVAASPDFASCIAMLREQSLRHLSIPWPRSQDHPAEHFKRPAPNDFAVAVSHGWPYQAHPDPLGAKAEVVKALLDEAVRKHNPMGETLCFLDFCSVTQRPFREGQAERTEEESRQFNAALACMPKIYLLVDAVLHVDMPWEEAPGDGEVVYVDVTDLEGVEFLRMGPFLQVISHGHPKVRLFDVLQHCGGKSQLREEDVERMRIEATSQGHACPVELRRSLFGNRNEIPTGDRGWIYLERFVSMVKAAMVDESEFERVCFSNSPAVLEQIRAGGARLRLAARGGEQKLMEELFFFLRELDQKHFSGGSTDKASGGAAPGLNQGAAKASAAAAPSDREVVASIMQEMVRALPALWAEETCRQRQRQLLLAVNRGDALAVEELLTAAADVNHRGERGVTCLHRAALYDGIDVARALIRHHGDVTIQDADGNCPAHQVYLMMSPHLVDFFELLVPSPAVWVLNNSRGVSPLERFKAWAITANGNQLYMPAQALLERLSSSFPELDLGAPETNRRSTSALPGAAAVQHQSREYLVCGEAMRVEEWSGQAEMPAVHVVWVSWSQETPPAMQQQALEHIGQRLWMECRAKLYVLNSVGRLFRNPSARGFTETLQRAIEALPLPEGFVIVLDFEALAVPLIPELQHRLLGIVLLNIPFCIPEDIFFGGLSKGWVVHVAERIESWQRRDLERLANVHVSAAFVSTHGQLRDLEEAWKVALGSEDEDYFAFKVWQLGLVASGEMTSGMNSMVKEKVTITVPAALVCGALASEVAIVQSMQRLQPLFPESSMSYIPQSKPAFYAEGRTQWDAVANVVASLVKRAAAA